MSLEYYIVPKFYIDDLIKRGSQTFDSINDKGFDNSAVPIGVLLGHVDAARKVIESQSKYKQYLQTLNENNESTN